MHHEHLTVTQAKKPNKQNKKKTRLTLLGRNVIVIFVNNSLNLNFQIWKIKTRQSIRLYISCVQLFFWLIYPLRVFVGITGPDP